MKDQSDPGTSPGTDPATSTGARPGSAEDWIERDAALVWHGFTQMATYAGASPIVVDRAEGREVIDAEGHRYLDAISSLWLCTLGHRVPELDEALVRQLGKVAHSTLLGNGNTVVVDLAGALAKVVPVEQPHMMFASDGAAAVEQALKIAFQYWWNIGAKGRTSYLALGGAYHGDTVGSLSVGAGEFGTALFDPLRFPVVRTPGYDDPRWLDAALRALQDRAGDLAAVVVEPLVQAAAGMHIAIPGDLRRLGEACRDHGVLLICDEVATGFGRTGSLFASTLCDLSPDLMCLGKGITGGYLPMSATVASSKVFDAFLDRTGEGIDRDRTFYHGHSYGGNALAAAVALRHLELIEEWDVLSNVKARTAELGEALASSVAMLDAVSEVRQCGLMVGVELASPSPHAHLGRLVSQAAVRRGVLLRPLGDVVVIMPPLTVSSEEIARVVEVLRESILEQGDASVRRS